MGSLLVGPLIAVVLVVSDAVGGRFDHIFDKSTVRLLALGAAAERAVLSTDGKAVAIRSTAFRITVRIVPVLGFDSVPHVRSLYLVNRPLCYAFSFPAS